MKSITIHGLDKEMETLIKAKANANQTSLNKTIKRLLEEALGIKPKSENLHQNDFADLFGIWSKSEKNAFDKSVNDIRKINETDWK